jgi:predicted metal-dependent hydrolase
LYELNREFFEDSVSAHITWGRMPSARRRRSIRFGSYSAEEDLIRIHPLLDQGFVPAFFVRYIVFHEMLHAHLGIEETPSGRRAVHTREFRRREKAYPDYDCAIAWQAEKANLAKLLKKAASA